MRTRDFLNNESTFAEIPDFFTGFLLRGPRWAATIQRSNGELRMLDFPPITASATSLKSLVVTESSRINA